MLGQRIGRPTCLLLLALTGCDRAEAPSAPAAQSSTVVGTVPAPSASTSTTSSSTSLDAGADEGVDVGSATTNDAAPEVAPALPSVRVANIGMHIGGGPNDDVTKAPIAKSVAPHFDELAACFALLEKPMKVELGVDLTIEATGGKAKVGNPRSTAPGTALRDCGVRVFEAIEFLPPKTGKTIVSYSVQFTPQKP